jgi:tyrosine-protein kinase Etk/Wzc
LGRAHTVSAYLNMSLENKQTPAYSEDEELSIVALLNVLLDRRKLIAAIASVFLAIAGLYVLLAQPIYSSKILIAVEDSSDASSAKNLLGDLSAMFAVKSSADGEIQILGSRLVAAKTVDALALNVRAEPRYFPLIGRWIASRSDGLSNPGLFGWGGFDWGTETVRLASFDVPRALQGKSFKLVALTGRQYELSADGLAGSFIGVVNKLERFETPHGQISLKVAALAGREGAAFVLRSRSRQSATDNLIASVQIAEQGKRSGVIAARLDGTDPVLISQTLNELGRQYVQQNADRRAAQAAHSLDFLQGQLPVMKQQLEDAETKLSQYQNEHTVVDLSDAGRVMLQKSSDADTQLVTLQQKRQELATRFGPAHPAIHAIDEQIGAVEQQINRIAALIRQMPLTEQDLLKLQRDVRVGTELYIATRSNVEQLRLVKAGKIGNVRLVDIADVPEVPIKPRKLITLIAALMLGLFTGAAVAIVKDRMFTGFVDADSLEAHTALSVFATVPYSAWQEAGTPRARGRAGRPILAVERGNDPAVEGIRSLRTALSFALLNAPNNVVLMTGPTPSLGKSFVSVNLATVLATAGKRVLLIDADMRKGYLNQYFGLGREEGLADAIVDKRPFAAVAHKGVLPNLDFVASGHFPPNPSELLLHRNWSELIAQASREYDVVIVDAPPVLPVSDVEALSGVAGTIFLVARFEVTRGGDLSESLKRLQKVGAEVTGVIFNAVKPRGGIHGGKHGGYRYTDYSYHQDNT